MPGRLDHVIVATSRKAFRDVGATRPVKLSDEDAALLLDVLERWSERVNVDGLPAGVWGLRCLLADDSPG